LSCQITLETQTSVSKEKESLKEFRGFLEKCVYSLFSDYKRLQKSLTNRKFVNRTFNFVRIIIENVKNQKKRQPANQNDALEIKKKEIYTGCS
jgi:hypothetical protein